MRKEHDFVVRGGTLVDGRGGSPVVADVAIDGDRISEVGIVSGQGREEIDAAGMLVTPGFVDVHTHYDGQSIWETTLAPSSGHGVTTVVMGNCGVGFAPCRAPDRARLIELMEGVEDIPGVVMTTGLPWCWETFPEFLDAVESRPHDINIAAYLPHSALRVYVMGERAVQGEAATPQDIEAMARIAREAMEAGAIGFATSRTLFHRSRNGEVIPTVDAGEAELTGIAKALQSAGKGILQFANDYKSYGDVDGEFEMMKRISQASNRPLTLPTAQAHSQPELWRDIVRRIEQANREGVPIKGQVLPRGIGMLLGIELSMHPFSMTPTYRSIADLPFAERVEKMRDPAVRAAILSDPLLDPTQPLVGMVRNFDRMFEGGEPLDYEPHPDQSIAARAQRAGISPAELAYDLMLERDGHAILFLPFANYAHGNLDAVAEMVLHEDFVVGLGDGGAHYGVICDASYSTFMLTHWTRDRRRGARISVPQAVKALAWDTARMVGLHDRGLLAPGYKADLNVIDYDRLTLHAPEVRYDLPAGGRRLAQRADGYVMTMVNGSAVYRDGQATGALPGNLLRGPQPEPAH